MRRIIAKNLQKYSFWLAMLIHLLILLSLSVALIPQTKSEEKLDLYIPSYAYHEPAKSYQQQPKAMTQKDNIPTSKLGIKKPTLPHKAQPLNQVIDISSAKNAEPVHLVGEKGVAKPLIILLGKALTQHLVYPRIALDLHVRGVSVIGFMLHPDGRVTDIHLLKSSTADILDQAALTAASEISPVKNVGLYVKEPKPIVFGIIFGSKE